MINDVLSARSVGARETNDILSKPHGLVKQSHTNPKFIYVLIVEYDETTTPSPVAGRPSAAGASPRR
ncbi:unnamed protein product, partial [Brenthis ino]